MKYIEIKLIPIFLLSVLGLNPASATKLSAPPLPHRSDIQGINAQEIVPPLTRYNRSQKSENQENGNQKGSSTNSKKEIPNNEELEKVKAEKERKFSALAANNKAVQLGQAGKFEEAIAAHEQAVQLEPENKQYRINLSAAYCAYGQRLLAKSNFAAAAHYFRQSITIAPDNALAGRLLIESLKKSGINPNSADDRLAIADQLLSQGDIAGAGIEYQAAEQLEESARTFVKMGDYAYRLGQADLATNWYQQATVKDPEYGAAYRQLGFIALAKGDQSQAASLLRKAIILDSKDTTAGITLVNLWRKQVSNNPQVAENHLGLASALQLTGDLTGAELEYQKVAAIDQHHPALPAAQASLAKSYQHAEAQRHKAAADTLWNQGLKQEALSEISQAVRLEPRNTQYQYFLAECLESTGNLQGAHQAYLTCVLLDPENNQEAAVRIKALQQTVHNKEVNTNAANNSYAQSPQNSVASNQTSNPTTRDVASPNDDTTKIIADKIQALEQSHDYEEAINVLRELVSNNLESPEMHHHLAVDLMSNGEIGEAVSEFRIASALSPGQKVYAADLAQALTINKQSLTKNVQSSEVDKTAGQVTNGGIK